MSITHSIAAEPTLKRRLRTVDEYHRMGEAGILDEDDRVELIEGELIEMAPIGAWVSVRKPSTLPPHSEPQPGNKARPAADNALLVIEVADTTLTRDRDVKLPSYARNGVTEVWIVNLARRVVHVYRQPGPDGYRELFERTAGETPAPLALPSAAIELAELFGD